MKKAKLLIILILTMSIIGGCSSSNTPHKTATETTTPTVTTSTEKEPTVTDPTSYPLTITDQMGREVTIEKEPEKIVSGYYISTSLLIALELEDKTVGIESKPEKRPIYQLAAPQYLELPNVGTMKEFNLEATIALEPDLVILPVKLKDSINALQELGITVLAINPESNDLVQEMITIVSTATNKKDRGNQLIEAINTYQQKLNTVLDGVDTKKVYLSGNSDFLSTAGSKMYQNSIITLAKGNNVASELEDTYWAKISYEQLLTWNPDVIILASDAEYTVGDVLNNENIKGLTAIQNNAVKAMPKNLEAWDSPVPSSVLGALWIAYELYPEKYSKAEFNQDVRDFYTTFYHIDIKDYE